MNEKLENERYDRHMRLIGEHGQKQLAQSNILIYGCDGIDIGKLLCLYGVSSIHLIDDRIVTEEMIDLQYFLKKNDLDKSMSESMINNMRTLNSNVSLYSYQTMDEIEVVNDIDLIIIFNYDENKCKLINGVPILSVHSNNWEAIYHPTFLNHYVIEGCEERNLRPRLYFDHILSPIEEWLEKDEINENSPFPLIIFKALQIYRSQNGTTSFPSDGKEKKEIMEIIEQMENDLKMKVPNNELLNLKEALSHVNSLSKTPTVELLPEAIENDNSLFNKSIYVIRLFSEKENENVLPFNGVIPDMETSSMNYHKIYSMYHQLHKSHIKEIRRFWNKVYKEDDFPEIIIEKMCKFSEHIHRISSTSTTIDESWLKKFVGKQSHPYVNTAIGSIVAQEVIKLLTHQLVPISSTIYYNGLSHEIIRI
ncbi:hypothetical protein SNEBB_004113 [Seison nebaliae]|nr:hypothetical protein SNEBB_004113 [Seison nebaliae]